ncbi:hypothetical protein [uncultured Psychroserpens sp.]|uniref:hypothetical protein n=1 Tax=uncultured Psychroserpens sp. TaxID=255436 RepID=UPI00261F9B3D|nr:hypothetical protein [uncultured Psychroserpens sp.]
MEKLTFKLIVLNILLMTSCAENSKKEVISSSLGEYTTSKNSEENNSITYDASEDMQNYTLNTPKEIVGDDFENSFTYKDEIDDDIEDIQNELYLFNTNELEADKSSNVKFNIPENCNRISGKSWRCCGKVIVNWDGSMSSQIHTSSNRWQGFTGAIRIIFYDSNQNAIYEVHTPSYGVNGESSRWASWNAQVDDWVIQTSQYASAEGIHKSSNRTGYFIYDLGKKYLEQYISSQ